MTIHRNRLTLALVLFGLWLIPNDLFAGPEPPLLVVNHETKECGQIQGGDECSDCFPPDGWKILGYAGFEVTCPAGYTPVEHVSYTCKPFKAEFCCSEGHSGRDGDCEDMIVNYATKQCAFVEDLTGCIPPQGWEKIPSAIKDRPWQCPSHYDWIEPIQCLPQIDSVDEPQSNETDRPPFEVHAAVLVLLILAVTGLVLVVLVILTKMYGKEK